MRVDSGFKVGKTKQDVRISCSPTLFIVPLPLRPLISLMASRTSSGIVSFLSFLDGRPLLFFKCS